jgi:uncharacterized PurR-regulated membrane protein YhhQ (DUF165 family)
MLIFLFLASILLANLMVTYMDPVPVGFGLYAPAGVYLVAVTLVLRDLVQRFSGVWGLVCAGVGGIALSYWLASPAVTTASVVAFAVSFLVDTAVYTAVRRWITRRLSVAALISGLVSLVPDTFVFLGMAGLLEYWPGQLVGKAVGTVIAVLVLWSIERKAQAVKQ